MECVIWFGLISSLNTTGRFWYNSAGYYPEITGNEQVNVELKMYVLIKCLLQLNDSQQCMLKLFAVRLSLICGKNSCNLFLESDNIAKVRTAVQIMVYGRKNAIVQQSLFNLSMFRKPSTEQNNFELWNFKTI